MNHKTKYRTPQNLSISSTKDFLAEVEPIFSLANQKINDVELITQQTEKTDLIGQLLLYKFIEYTIHKGCFNKPKTDLRNNNHIKTKLDQTGFLPFFNEFMNKKNNQLKSDIPNDYQLDWKESDTFYIAPIVLSKTKAYIEKEKNIYDKIRDYYNNDSTIVGTIMSCFSEVSSNFIEHADELTNSVIVASGNNDYFELACADTGIGVISSMRTVLQRGKFQIHDILPMTLNKGVTSKPGTFHSGAGLWLISQYVAFSKGDMYIFSEGAYCHQKKGHIKSGQCGKWKGTIIYVKIPLKNKSAIAEGKKKLSEQFNNVKISII